MELFSLGSDDLVWGISAEWGRNIIFAVGGFVGIILAARRMWLLNQQRKNDVQRLHTDSYIRAVEQLGGAKKEVRLGGIYGLGRIAKESETHRRQIIELLCAYIVENASGSKLKVLTPPPADIRATLEIIEDNRKEWEKWEGFNLNLQYVDFQNIFLGSGHFEGFDFRLANLKNASFGKAHLEEAQLLRANLEGANLARAHLEGAHLEGANLVGAKMARAKNLTQEQINKAFGDGGTKLPEHLKAPLHWPKIVLDASNSREEWQKWLNDPENYQPPQ